MRINSEIISAEQAITIASQWGSYMHDGDPGAVFYTFPAGKAIVQDEDHRTRLITYTKECLVLAKGKDKADLRQLLAYFKAALAEDARLSEMKRWTSSDGTIELQITVGQAESVSQPGKDAAADVAEIRKDVALSAQLDKIKDVDLRRELKEYGAWEDTELSDRDANLMRLVWIAGCNIREGHFDEE